ncbi:MAG: nucleoside-diphosphate kinase [Planctomycetes bacterium]|nr:nucleoside-diphosphate kinase [Planctomycetota bacterium]
MASEQSLVLIKPDAVQRRFMGDIISRFENKGLSIQAMSLVQASKDQAEAHYSDHKDKGFFPAVVGFISSSPLVALVIAGDDAISVVRTMIGATDGRKAAPGTIRGDFACSMGANLVHASDSAENATKEMAIWFPDNAGVLDWSACDEGWLDAD